MVLAILAFMFVVLLTGLVVAASIAVQARRRLEDLENQFPDPHGLWVDPESEPTPWSSVDLTDLHDDATVREHDPFASLGADSPLDWHAASDPNASEPNPTTNGAPSADVEPTVHPAPVTGSRPLAWRATRDAPVVVFVVGSGFLGTGTTVAATEARRRTWQMADDDAFTVTLNADDDATTQPSPDRGPTGTGVAAADGPNVDQSWRDASDRVQHLLDELKTPITSNGTPSEPPADPKPIAWRPPERTDHPRIVAPRTRGNGRR